MQAGCAYKKKLVHCHIVMSRTQKNRARTYARNRTAVSRRGYEKIVEADSAYFLKLVLFFVLGTFWLKFEIPLEIGSVLLPAFPLGMIVGLLIVHKVEKLQFNRKIWYAVLLIVGLISLYLPAGIVI